MAVCCCKCVNRYEDEDDSRDSDDGDVGPDITAPMGPMLFGIIFLCLGCIFTFTGMPSTETADNGMFVTGIVMLTTGLPVCIGVGILLCFCHGKKCKYVGCIGSSRNNIESTDSDDLEKDFNETVIAL